MGRDVVSLTTSYLTGYSERTTFIRLPKSRMTLLLRLRNGNVSSFRWKTKDGRDRSEESVIRGRVGYEVGEIYRPMKRGTPRNEY